MWGREGMEWEGEWVREKGMEGRSAYPTSVMLHYH